MKSMSPEAPTEDLAMWLTALPLRHYRTATESDMVHFEEVIFDNDFNSMLGAGSGNRTRIFSLEGCCSTTELYPRISPENRYALFGPRLCVSGLPGRQWWRGLDLNQRRHSQRIYSPSPLTTRAPLQSAAGAMQRGIDASQPP
jgi:hypothetical protein